MATTNGNAEAVRAQIARKNRVPSERFYSNEWDCEFEVRGLTLGARSRIQQAAFTGGEDTIPIMEKYHPMMLRAGVFHAQTGEPIWPDSIPDAEINALDPRETDKLVAIVMRLSAMSQAEDRKLKKDFATIPDMRSSSSRKGSARRSRNLRPHLTKEV